MSRQILVLDEAAAEIESSRAWYEAQREGLGREFVTAIRNAIDALGTPPSPSFPVLGVPPSGIARAIMVRRFPFSVVFLERHEEIWVVAVAHQRRKPGYWRDRTKRPPSR